MSRNPAQLAPEIVRLRELTEGLGRPQPEVATMTGLPGGGANADADFLRSLEEVGITRVIAAAGRYSKASEFGQLVDQLAAARDAMA